ncbi:MAG: hypothetical protein ACLPPF_11180 [Rhodomicrobium sp.]
MADESGNGTEAAGAQFDKQRQEEIAAALTFINLVEARLSRIAELLALIELEATAATKH